MDFISSHCALKVAWWKALSKEFKQWFFIWWLKNKHFDSGISVIDLQSRLSSCRMRCLGLSTLIPISEGKKNVKVMTEPSKDSAFIGLLNLIETSIVIQQESLSSSSSSKYLIPILAQSSFKYLIFTHCKKALKGVCVCSINRKPQFSILSVAFKCFYQLGWYSYLMTL